MEKSRRNFIIQSALAASALSLDIHANAAKPPFFKTIFLGEKKVHPLKVSIFSKNLHWLNWNEMAVAVKQMGFDGIDLTVRPDGHVLPERVAEDLPQAVTAIRKQGLEVYMITTAITKAAEPTTPAILKTAGELGIKNYRMGWYSYDKKLSIADNQSNFKKELQALSLLNKKYKIHGDYQNHAGGYFGAAVLDLWMVLKDLDPAFIGSQYDIRHATVEGAHSWPVGFGLLKNYIASVNFKDFQWAKKDGKWQEQNMPLGTGMVDFSAYFKALNNSAFNGPVSLHYEYELGGAENGSTTLTIPKEQVLSAMQRDLETFKKMYHESLV
ncbi:MAG: sugar phosphate isomerase/epimerase [Bacteroidota bacterium]|nr:sugar phosphate isomerase/epimerase [Bacteroidota bacterium]